MTSDGEKNVIEREKLGFEREKFDLQRALDERKFRSEVSAKKWSQIATFVPILVVILGFYFSQTLESAKKTQEAAIAQRAARIQFVERQLSDFYYPVKMRLERDNAIWEVSAQNKSSTANLKIADDIEARLILPNHQEIMELIKGKFHLLTNDAEQVDIAPLILSMNRYQRHVTIYKALRESNDSRFPLSICEDCGYPKEFENEVYKRIQSLERQRSELLASRSK